MDKKYKIIDATVIGTLVTVMFITIMTIYGEFPTSSEKFIFKLIFRHQWVGKGIVAYGIFGIAFGICYLLPYVVTRERIVRRMHLLFVTTVLLSITILVFYIYWFLHYSTVF